ncbi:hypothetical protein RJT34_03003 [Clitoria ternatea]|uniref:Uncharacterized protein n=1 Tax=Clitoria ternatea TaxID=43366 RepID=A0AAN9Q240_CLITE
MHFTITLSLFFLGVLAFITDLGGGGAMGLRVYYSHDLPNETNDAHLGPPGSGIIVEERRGRRHKKCIEIVQGAIWSDGWPTNMVEIVNRCQRDCRNIHVNCSGFSDGNLVWSNPKIIRVLKDSDCLVNDGKPVHSGTNVSFTYTNWDEIPFSVTSLQCD